jgi:hypothetical protein
VGLTWEAEVVANNPSCIEPGISLSLSLSLLSQSLLPLRTPHNLLSSCSSNYMLFQREENKKKKRIS